MEEDRVSVRAFRITRRHSDARDSGTSGERLHLAFKVTKLKFSSRESTQRLNNCSSTKKGVKDDLLLAFFKEKLQISTSWLHWNLCDLGDRIGITHQLEKIHRIRMRVVGQGQGQGITPVTGPWKCFRADKAGLSSTTWQQKKRKDEMVRECNAVQLLGEPKKHVLYFPKAGVVNIGPTF